MLQVHDVLSFGVFIQPFARGDKGFQYSLTNNLLVWHMQSLSYLVMAAVSSRSLNCHGAQYRWCLYRYRYI